MNKSQTQHKNTQIFVISGPSGAGKHSIIAEVLKRDPNLVLAITATTRPPRTEEKNGVHYYFLSNEEFDKRIQQGDFLEWANVHGYRYGTLRDEVLRHLNSGKDVLLQVDIQGMRSLKKSNLPITTIFITPPSLEELIKRLNKRGSESTSTLTVRIENAQKEIEAQKEYDYVVLNDVLAKAVDEVTHIIQEIRELHNTKKSLH